MGTALPVAGTAGMVAVDTVGTAVGTVEATAVAPLGRRSCFWLPERRCEREVAQTPSPGAPEAAKPQPQA